MEGLKGQLMLLSGIIMLFGCITLTMILNEYIQTMSIPIDISGKYIVLDVENLVRKSFEDSLENVTRSIAALNVTNETLAYYISSNVSQILQDVANATKMYYGIEGRYVNVDIDRIDVVAYNESERVVANANITVLIIYNDEGLEARTVVNVSSTSEVIK
ncbi:hypothetical protein [Archaeoglobus profundus]|uniref:Uncharacterized protein n=1 Tax=Archaeoglobus profundus (strain DSM 5631 / JCM 9629 / NBRC 100127 / Av18) TaxID=572546 RepID=D2RHK5_ARCPA|nr:hypothetical protein [Archaeoglobus profundus]ADB57780.1 hypothetical protein Arcpr_0716 [Archaeoglobus profundus DSM 5631]